MKRLIRTDTGEAVSLAGIATADGRVLVQRVPDGPLAVINVDQLAAEDDPQDGVR